MKLNIPFLSGGEQSLCGCASIEMILRYYNISYNPNDITDILHESKGGTDMPQIGRVLMRYNLQTSFVSLHPGLFSQKDQVLTQKQIYDKIEKIVEFPSGTNHDRITIANLRHYMEEGGHVEVTLPSFRIVKNELKNNRPVIAFFATQFMSGGRSTMNYHPTVLTGYDDKNIYCNDPNTTGGEKKIKSEWFFSGIYASHHEVIDDGSLLLISKK